MTVGLDVIGVVPVDGYDALVTGGWRSEVLLPEARSAVIIGAGGPRLALRALARGGEDPVDRLTAEACEASAERLRRVGGRCCVLHYWERRDAAGLVGEEGEWADFVGLAAAAGLGSESRLRLLLHPTYGPWWSVRAVLLTDRPLAPTPLLAAAPPCEGCPAPCRTACPAAALDDGALDWSVYAPERARAAVAARPSGSPGDACDLHCASRRACVVGPDHAYPPPVEAHFMRTSLSVALTGQG